MKNFKMMLIMVLLCFAFSMNISLVAEASDTPEFPECAEYNISEGGTQSFELINSSGDAVYITISKEFSMQIRSISNGTYQITFTSPGAWKAGYKIVVSGDKISSAYSPYYSTITGSITSSKLYKDSTKQVSYHLTYRVQGIYISTGIRSIISGNSIKVYAI